MSELSPFTPDDWKTPDDIAGLIAEINSRAEQRRKATDIMFKNADAATTDGERMKWLTQAMQFVSIDEEFCNTYSELFPDDASE